MQCRCLGAAVEAWSDADADGRGQPLIDEVGELVCVKPMPSMPLYFWGDEPTGPHGRRYHDSYFDMYRDADGRPVWRHGDWLRITPRGGAIIYGRSDATINRHGSRMGTAELYRAVEALPEVVDSLVVDLEYLGRDSYMPLFVVLREGLVLDEGVLMEIVRPGTGDPVPDGEVGEVVVTTFNRDYPLVRLGTGDLSAVLPGPCPTGRTNTRIKGWLGRADQTTKVRGMFVHPGQVATVLKRFPEVLRARLVVEGEMADDRMTLRIETAPDRDLAQRVADAVREVTRLRCAIECVAPGSLPNDGRVIEDARRYE
jgi:acyl-coenzyme A synthetase/AMP-(fatty) acid ligase